MTDDLLVTSDRLSTCDLLRNKKSQHSASFHDLQDNMRSSQEPISVLLLPGLAGTDAINSAENTTSAEPGTDARHGAPSSRADKWTTHDRMASWLFVLAIRTRVKSPASPLRLVSLTSLEYMRFRKDDSGELCQMRAKSSWHHRNAQRIHGDQRYCYCYWDNMTTTTSSEVQYSILPLLENSTE